jgi:hypothetical protein
MPSAVGRRLDVAMRPTIARFPRLSSFGELHMTQIHRVRFLDFIPEAINALAFDDTGSRLAVGRANSDVEVWNIDNGWHHELVCTAFILCLFTNR